MSDTKSSLLGTKHVDTSVEEVIAALQRDDQAFYDPKTNLRRVPIFAYDNDGNRTRITHWQERPVAPVGMTRAEAELAGLDYYMPGRGWIRLGKKAERDYDAPRK